MVVLGVDPSTVATGWGIVDGDSRSARAVDWGTLRASSRKPLDERLHLIHTGLVEVMRSVPIQQVVLESPFLARNVKTAFALGQVRGVILLAARQVDLPVCEYAPLEIKRAAVGYGTADKDQVAHMMTRILGLRETPDHDAADALAAAWCHLARCARPVRIGGTP
jgi:crossover junction endodeoxyribonuclease RuvC